VPVGFDRGVARRELLLIEVIDLEVLLEREEMLRSVV
jgi:hypothetical protein